jgi:hypothetical protein
LKIKLKSRHFDTTEVIDAELRVVLNTLTEHDLTECILKCQKHWEWCIHMKGDYFEVVGG